MSEEKKYRTFTAADIEKYHKGLLSSKERHDLEKAALDDPFLADALEGYSYAGATAANDIAELKKRLKERTGGKVVIMRTKYAWWKVAAMIILIGGAGFLVYQFAFNNEKQNVAQLNEENKNETSVIKDSSDNPPVTTTQNETPAKAQDKIVTDQNANNQETVTVTAGLSGKSSGEVTGLGLSDTLSITDFKKGKAEVVTLAPQKLSEKETDVAKTEAKNLNNPAIDKDGDGIAEKFDKEKQGITANKDRAVTFSRKYAETNRANYFRGRVMDSTNNALPFANITNTTDNVGTYADAKGYFTLISPDSVLTVQVRSVGFENNNIELRSDVTTNKVVLQEDRSLSEIVLNNYRPNESRLQELREANKKIEEPEPVDGWGNYDTYLVNNLKAPDEQRTKQLNGQVEVSFEVNKNGEPINIKIERSLCKSCDEEAIRLVKEGPKWKRKGKNRARVAVPFSD